MINDSRITKHRLGFYQILDKPSEEQLEEYYAKKYFQESSGSYENIYDEEEYKWKNLRIEYCFHIVQLLNKKSMGKILDIGCGEGFTRH